MQERTNRLQRGITYALVLIGILGTAFLVFLVIDNRSIDVPETLPEAEPADILSDAVAFEQETPTDIPIGIRIGQRAPDFQLRSLENKVVSLSDFLGQIVILDFWASWCAPCRLTMPGLEDIARSLASDVVLLGVSLDRTEANATNYLARNKFDAMIALYESYSSAFALFRTYGDGGIPRTFVIDREGIIRFVGHPARLSRQTIEGLL